MDLELPPDFKEFLRLLKEYNVRYLLIGGYAVGYHGYARATEDMDIWVAIHPDNAQKIVTVLKVFGFDLPELKPELFLREKQIIRMGILLLSSKSALLFQALTSMSATRGEL